MLRGTEDLEGSTMSTMRNDRKNLWNRSRSLILGGTVAIGMAATAMAGPIYEFEFDPEFGGTGYDYNPEAGEITRFYTRFDTNTNALTLEVNFAHAPNHPNVMPDGFTFVVSDGDNPIRESGQFASMYFDATNANPIMSAYGYNGSTALHPWEDGSKDPGIQTPDRIESSLNNANWLSDIFVTDEANGTRTMGFTMDATSIIDHLPLYPGSEPWQGAQFAEKVGIWFHPWSNLATDYDQDGWLTQWDSDPLRRGFFDGANFNTTQIPLPGVLMIGLAGLGGVMVARRRMASDRDAT